MKTVKDWVMEVLEMWMDSPGKCGATMLVGYSASCFVRWMVG